jgi:hypothetical protein
MSPKPLEKDKWQVQLSLPMIQRTPGKQGSTTVYAHYLWPGVPQMRGFVVHAMRKITFMIGFESNRNIVRMMTSILFNFIDNIMIWTTSMNSLDIFYNRKSSHGIWFSSLSGQSTTRRPWLVTPMRSPRGEITPIIAIFSL